jgi:ABC-type phosphate transport system permease subunit
LFWGTIFIGAIIAMLVAIPLGLMSAIYLTQYASANVRKWMKPLLEILAGVPTVVYGYFAALTVAPLVRDAAQGFDLAQVVLHTRGFGAFDVVQTHQFVLDVACAGALERFRGRAGSSGCERSA